MYTPENTVVPSCGILRIIQLWEPFKENQSPRTMESWQNLVVKLRLLLLLSFNRHLGKFEDQVRSLREKRTEPRWSFTTYFLLHVSRRCFSNDDGNGKENVTLK